MLASDGLCLVAQLDGLGDEGGPIVGGGGQRLLIDYGAAGGVVDADGQLAVSVSASITVVEQLFTRTKIHIIIYKYVAVLDISNACIVNTTLGVLAVESLGLDGAIAGDVVLHNIGNGTE